MIYAKPKTARFPSEGITQRKTWALSQILASKLPCMCFKVKENVESMMEEIKNEFNLNAQNLNIYLSLKKFIFIRNLFINIF